MITRNLFLRNLNPLKSSRAISFTAKSDRLVYDPRKSPKQLSEAFEKESFEQMLSYIPEFTEPDYANKEDRKRELFTGKREGYFLDRKTYQLYLDRYKEGDVTYVKLDNNNMIFIGCSQYETPLKNIYKALNLAKPDCIVLQAGLGDREAKKQITSS